MRNVGLTAVILLASVFLAACRPATPPTEPADPATPSSPSASSAPAPTIAGSWEGVLHAQGAALELVFHVSEGPQGLEATIDSVTQGVNGIPVEEATYQDGRLLLEAKSILGVLDVNLEGDNTLRGKWNQAGQSFPLELTRAE